ncbi:MAG: hypothetical protein WEC39_01510 [Patescibacteria group bacterium]
MKKQIYSLISLSILILFPFITQGQEAGYPPIEPDESFEPYVRFEEETGRYYIAHLRDAETGKIYEAVYEPPTLISPTLNMSLEFDQLYWYSYVLVNGGESRQGVSSFRMYIKEQFHEIDFPDPWFYRESRTEDFIQVVHRRFQRQEREEGEPIMVESDLSIGDSLQFIVESEYPPSITDVFVSGRPTVLNFHFVLAPLPEVQDLRDSLRTQVEGADHRGVLVKTIGPKAIPENTTNTELADTLSSYVTQSCDLGWIENQGICRSLQANLDNVKRQLEQGNTQTAANNLQAFLNEVGAIKDRHLSSEAYALLKYNGEYLLNRLKEQD